MITPAYGLTATERVLPSFVLDWTTGLAQDAVDVARTGVATYIDSSGVLQLAAENTQRVDYSTGVSGLLVEESRTNLARDSEDLTNTDVWATLSEHTIVANQAVAPDGTMTADRIDVGVAGVFSRTFQTFFGITIGATYIASFWLWADEGQAASVNLQLVNTSNNTLGTLVAVLSTTPTRFFVSGVADATEIRIQLRARQSNKSFYAWGAQLEPGAFPTSYIPTTSSAVTRNADRPVVTGANFSDFYNQAEGTIYVQFARGGLGIVSGGGTSTPRVIQVKGPTASIQLRLASSSNLEAIATNINIARSWSSGQVNAAVLGYKLDNFGLSVNQASFASDTSGSSAQDMDELYLGTRSVDSGYLNGHIQKIMYWPQRLTNDELQAFSK